MAFGQEVLAQRDDTFERAFQQGYNLVVAGQEQRRAQEEHDARMDDFAERAVIREENRAEAALDRDVARAGQGLRRPRPDQETPIADALGGSARMQEQRDQGITPPRPGTVSPFAMPGATGERPPFGMAADPDAGGVQPQAPELETQYEPRAIVPLHPEDFEDVQTFGEGDNRYASSRLFNEQIAQSEAGRAAEFGREQEAADMEYIDPEEQAQIDVYRAENPETELDDLGVLAQIATDQYTQRYDRPGSSNPGAVEARTRMNLITERADARMEALGADQNTMPEEVYRELYRRVWAEEEQVVDQRRAGTVPGMTMNAAGEQVPLADFSQDELLAGGSVPDDATIGNWWSVVRRDTDQAAAVTQAITDLGNEAAVRIVHQKLLALIQADWDSMTYSDPNKRPGRTGANLQANIFNAAQSAKDMADIVVYGSIQGG